MLYAVLSTVRALFHDGSHMQARATSKDTGLCRQSRFAGPFGSEQDALGYFFKKLHDIVVSPVQNLCLLFCPG